MSFVTKPGELYWKRRLYDEDGSCGPWCMVLCLSANPDGACAYTTIYSPSVEAECSIYGKQIRCEYILVPKPIAELKIVPPQNRK